MEDERNKKGQFKPGHKGGPGRGKKEDRYAWVDDPVKFTQKMASMARRELAAMFNDPDKKVRQDALKLHARYLGMENEPRIAVLDPALLKVFGAWFLDHVDGKKDEG